MSQSRTGRTVRTYFWNEVVVLKMATERNRILAVIDPTRGDQWALQKAISIAKDRNDFTVCAFLCVYSNVDCDDPERLRSVELRRHEIWLEKIITELPDAGISIEPVVVWSDDWPQAVCLAANNDDDDLVIKMASGRQKSLASSDRQLIRTLQCALLLIKHDPADELQKILVAVDFNAMDESHVALNDAIMALGNRIRGARKDIALHSISAYPSSDKFVHPPDVAKILGIDRAHAQVQYGDAADVIPQAANKIQADLVIIGNVGRRGLSGITIGNTAEKILADIDSDVLVLVRELERELSVAI